MAEGALRLLVAGCSWPLETFLERLFEGLASQGIDVTIATAATPDVDWLRRSGIKWLRAPGWDGPWLFRAFRLVRMSLRAAAASRRDVGLLKPYVGALPSGAPRVRAWYRLLPLTGRRSDVLYFPWNAAAIDYLGLYDLGIPVLVSCRGSQMNIGPHDPERKELREGLRVTLSRAAAVHCVCRAIQTEAAAYGLDPARSRVIHPAVDPERFAPNAVPPRRRVPRVIAVGALSWKKGFEYAIRAIHLARIGGIDMELEIVGEGPDRQRLLFGIEDLSLSGRVRLLGRLVPDRVRDREAVTDGVEGFVVPVRDVRRMADALARLAGDPGLRTRMGAAARARILGEFALANQVRAFAELLEEVQACPRA